MSEQSNLCDHNSDGIEQTPQKTQTGEICTAYAQHEEGDEDSVASQVHAVFCGTIKVDRYNLSTRHFAILVELNRNGARKVLELADQLTLPKSTTSRALDALQRVGLVRRKREGNAVMVSMTPKSQALIGRVMAQLATTER